MSSLIYLLPLLGVLGCLARGVGPVRAGLVGLALTLPVAAAALGGPVAAGPVLAMATGKAAWLAWPPVAVIIGGLFFYNAVRSDTVHSGSTPVDTGATAAAPAPGAHRDLFAACFLLGPFAESATGFGVGAIITGAVVQRMGVSGVAAAVCALFSQCLAAWGALSVGTALGAVMADMPSSELGVRTAVLCAPLLAINLVLFWRICRWMGRTVTLRNRIDDAVWIAGLALVLWLSNQLIPVEVAGLGGMAAVLALRFLCDRLGRRLSGAPPRMAGPGLSILPFAGLTLVLLVTRLVPWLSASLAGVWTIRPTDGWPAFAPFHHVSLWLILVGVATVLIRGQGNRWPELGRLVAKSARIPATVTVLFMIIAQWMMVSGMTDGLATAWTGVAGSMAPAAGPLFSAVSGFLTGSGVASNSLMMPLQIALAEQAGLDPHWMAAIQNTVGSSLSMLSPMRVAMACAIAAVPGAAAAVYGRLVPLALLIPGLLAGVILAAPATH